ncbi:MAG: phosphoribosyltransferase family protein [Bacteroidota bacterium]|nr:phosphoribosyltransferase family protein [Bacteroidota bacterium]
MKQSFFKSLPIFHLFYPHNCIGCGTDVIDNENFLCLECINDLPYTNFAIHANNPVEKKFWGRIAITSAMSEFYFSKASVIQNLIHEFKYKGNKRIGTYLGKIIGESLLNSHRFNVDAVIPLPLFEKKERKRGFNQAAILCDGISEVMNIPIITKNVVRIISTETQTRKHRDERWQNVKKSFSVLYPHQLEGKHLLLVDDVITTGATLEACASEILKVKSVTVSIAALALATR